MDDSWKQPRICKLKSCGVTFMPVRRDQLYHSAQCRGRAWNEARVLIRMTQEGMRRRSLATDFRNPVVIKKIPEGQAMLKYLANLEKESAREMRTAAKTQDYFTAAYWKAVGAYAAHAKKLFTPK